MIEPEMAFADIVDDMDLGEELVKAMTRHVMENCREDLELFAKFVDKSLLASLDTIVAEAYVRLPYAEAVDILSPAAGRSSSRCTSGPICRPSTSVFCAKSTSKNP